MKGRHFFLSLLLAICGTCGLFTAGVFLGYKLAMNDMNRTENTQPAPAIPAPSTEIDPRQWKGQMKVRLEGREFNFKRSSMIDEAHGNREWNSMACVDAGQGMTVKGRWDEKQWWISAHDAEHPYPRSIQVPVQNLPFSSVATK